MDAIAETQPAHDANQDDVRMLDMSRILVSPKRNPRRFKSAKHRSHLRESIRAKGVQQSVLVRPHPEREGYFELAAGYTRHDIATELDFDRIPARIKSMTDEQMEDAAATENMDREDMSPIDEGEQAKRLLRANNNDTETVCKLLGWSKKKLKSRMQLTRCEDEVAQALVDERITIRHAETLSALRSDTQLKALEMIENRGLTADQLDANIAKLSMKLDRAPFDKSDCQACPHNSSIQKSMFDNGINDGHCMNRQCFDAKVEEHLEAVKAQQQESFNRVEFDRDVAEGTTTVLAISGDQGVGQQQFEACQGCEYYGAIIKTGPGAAGAVQRHTCFNMTCNAEKRREYQELIATDAAPATTEPSNGSEKGQATSKGKTSSGKGAGAKKSNAAPAKTPTKILERIHKVHRHAAAETVAESERMGRILALVSLMADTEQRPDSTKLSGTVSAGLSDRRNRVKVIAELETLEDRQINELITEVAAKAMVNATKAMSGEREQDLHGGVAHDIAKRYQPDLTKHFTLDRDYLDAHTKPVIHTLLVNSGFAAHYDAQHGEGAFQKMVKGKKGDILDAVDNEGFDFTGFVPSNMTLEVDSGGKAEGEADKSESKADTDSEQSEPTLA